MNINPIRVLTTSDRKPPLLPNTEDLHAEKDAEDGLCQGPVGLRTHRSRRHIYVLQAHDAQFPIVGNGEGVWSWLHIEDAAIATVAAAEQGNPGIYLIANDQPLAVRDWLPAFARWLNAPPPAQVSVEDALKRDGGADAVYYGTKMRGVSNAKAKRELNLGPRSLEWLVD